MRWHAVIASDLQFCECTVQMCMPHAYSVSVPHAYSVSVPHAYSVSVPHAYSVSVPHACCVSALASDGPRGCAAELSLFAERVRMQSSINS